MLTRILSLTLLLAATVSLAGTTPVTLAQIETAIAAAPQTHPRLLATAAQWQTLRTQSQNVPLYQAGAGRILFDADQMLTLPCSTRQMHGRRLLAVSRRVLHRVTTLAMAYQLTENAPYLKRCVDEMVAAAAFSDWNPSHFLDVAEMTLALAIGYDWLYHALTPTERATIAQAIKEKGLETSIEHAGWWVRATNNWGQVCHAGMLAGAFALLDLEPHLAAVVTETAIKHLPLSMAAFKPVGSYPEGPGYWSYGTDFNVIAIDLLEGVLGTDYGLRALPGFEATAEYLDLVTGTSGLTFNYADGGSGRYSDCATWWFVKRYQRPDLLSFFEHEAYLKYSAARKPNQGTSGNRLFALSLLWLITPEPVPPRAPLNWHSQGSTPITIQRSSWDKKEALFVGLKAGSPAAPHGHMDAGSFVLDAQGIRWAYDLGAEDYTKIEARKMNLWSSQQTSDRWTIFRLSNFSHNTLVIDNQLQVAKGNAKVIEFNDTPPSRTVLDLTTCYNQAKRVLRTGTLLSARTYQLEDQIEGLAPGKSVRWAMATKAQPTILDTQELVLKERDKTLTLRPTADFDVQWQIYDIATPRNEWDSPNPGMRMVGFEVAAPASGNLKFSITFTANQP